MTATKKRSRAEENMIQRISEELREISDAIDIADAGFNEVSDDDLIEAMIFERSALRARYSYLLKELRKLESE